MDIKDVENLANLAKLDMSLEEKEGILKDMKGILDYVKQIEAVDVPDVKQEFDLYNAWREDGPVARDFSKDSIKEQFPDSKGGFLKVKKIL